MSLPRGAPKKNARGQDDDIQAGLGRCVGCQSALFSLTCVSAVTTQMFRITPRVISD